MKNIFEVLQQKESELTRVRQQLQCLRLVVALLAEEGDDKKPEAEKVAAGFP